MSLTKEIIHVILIDDHRRIHDAVALVLNTVTDIELVGQGSNGHEALQLCKELHPDLILMDVVMPNMSGLEATRLIHESYPAIHILVLSSFQDDETIYAMLRNGASGYILKGSLASDLITTIRTTVSGKSVFSNEITQVLLASAHSSGSEQKFDLTDREKEVLLCMVNGLSTHQIAVQLVISQSTVKFHVHNILQKMQVNTRVDAIVLAVRNNLF